jgi:hypothetical protein
MNCTDLLKRIDEIDKCYLSETDTIKSLLWAKLAVLEVSGWTEEFIDEMIIDYINSKISNVTSKELIMEKLKNISGFNYKKDFRAIWILIIGSINFDKIESIINIQCQQLESALNNLKKIRDQNAHTFVKPTFIIDAPSKTKVTLQQIENGLNTFKTELLKLP